MTPRARKTTKRAAGPRWRRIVVATDFSRTAGVALRSAESLAREIGGTIVLVHAIELPSATYSFGVETIGLPDIRERWAEEARRTLKVHADRSRARSGMRVIPVVRIGKPWFEIVETVREHGADAVCLGNSGHSLFERLLLGSTAENVVRHSPVPVLVTRGRALGALRRVLLPVAFDGRAAAFDEGSHAAIEFALSRLPRGAELEALHVVPPLPVVEPWMALEVPSIADATAGLRDHLDRVGAKRVRARVVLNEDPASAILTRGRRWRADLILLSTHGRRGVPRAVLGSVAERVARHADRPVLVLPLPGARRGTS